MRCQVDIYFCIASISVDVCLCLGVVFMPWRALPQTSTIVGVGFSRPSHAAAQDRAPKTHLFSETLAGFCPWVILIDTH
jgi:hypothetical protein